MPPLRTLFGEDADVLGDADFRLLLLGGLTAPLGVALLSPLLSTMTGPFGVSETRIGLLMAAYTAPAIVLNPVAGSLSDRFGRKPVLVGGVLLFGLAGTAVAATTSFPLALSLRIIQGAGTAGIIPMLVTAIGDRYAGATEATAQGLLFAVMSASQTVFPAVAGFLLVFGWRVPVAIYGLSIPIGLVLAVRLGETHPGEPGTEAGGGRSLRATLGILRDGHVVAALVVYALPSFLYIGFLTYVSIVVGRLVGGTPQEAGLLVGLFGVTMGATSSQVGRLTDRGGGYARPLAGGTVALVVGFSTTAFAGSVAVLAVGGALMGVGLGVLMPTSKGVLTAAVPAAVRGRLIAVGESLLRISLTVSPIVLAVGIGLARPSLGFEAAVRWILFAVGLVCGAATPAAVLVVGRREGD